jgi:hypothetical protein
MILSFLFLSPTKQTSSLFLPNAQATLKPYPNTPPALYSVRAVEPVYRHLILSSSSASGTYVVRLLHNIFTLTLEVHLEAVRIEVVTLYPISQDHYCYFHRPTKFHIQSPGVTNHQFETALENPVSLLIRKELIPIVLPQDSTGEHLLFHRKHGHGCYTLRQHVCLQLFRSGRCPHSREVFCIAFFTSTGVWVFVCI